GGFFSPATGGGGPAGAASAGSPAVRGGCITMKPAAFASAGVMGADVVAPWGRLGDRFFNLCSVRAGGEPGVPDGWLPTGIPTWLDLGSSQVSNRYNERRGN